MMSSDLKKKTPEKNLSEKKQGKHVEEEKKTTIMTTTTTTTRITSERKDTERDSRSNYQRTNRHVAATQHANSWKTSKCDFYPIPSTLPLYYGHLFHMGLVQVGPGRRCCCFRCSTCYYRCFGRSRSSGKHIDSYQLAQDNWVSNKRRQQTNYRSTLWYGKHTTQDVNKNPCLFGRGVTLVWLTLEKWLRRNENRRTSIGTVIIGRRHNFRGCLHRPCRLEQRHARLKGLLDALSGWYCQIFAPFPLPSRHINALLYVCWEHVLEESSSQDHWVPNTNKRVP